MCFAMCASMICGVSETLAVRRLCARRPGTLVLLIINNLMSRILLAVTLAIVAGSAGAQSSSRLVGTWRLLSMVRPDSSGRSQPYWDERPLGQIIYTPDGHMSAQLYDSRRPRLGVWWELAEPAAARTAFVGLVTYFGTYSVDTIASTVTHELEGAMAPDWVGTKLVRGYRFLGSNRVELRVITDATGRRVANGTVLVWERVQR